MIVSYFRLVLRHFLNDKLHTTIVVGGLAIGIASALIIAQYIQFELSFDKSVADRDDIYYTYLDWMSSDESVDGPCFPAMATLAKETMPEVIDAVRIVAPMGKSKYIVRREENGKILTYADVEDLYFVDPAVFSFFSIPLLKGDAKTALLQPKSIVITKSLAEKFFPSEDPINKILITMLQDGKKDESVVTGIVADPTNSSLRYNVFYSMNTVRKFWDLDHAWAAPEFQTFIKLQPGSDYKIAEAKLLSQAQPIRKLEEQLNTKISIHLFPFKDFHFFRHHNSHIMRQIQFTGDKRLLVYFAILGGLIILISWANYINLTTANAISRAKEIGLRKISGASRENLITQFFVEFFLLNAISILLALTVTQLSFDVFARIIGTKAEWIFWTKPVFWIAAVIWTIMSTIISGLYPALVISGYKPVKVLKGNFSRSHVGVSVRKVLVVFQFALSVFMIMSIYVISRQLHFMQQKDLGMSVDQVVVIPTTQLVGSKADSFNQLKMKLETNDRFRSLTTTSEYPGESIDRSMIFFRTLDVERKPHELAKNTVGENYFKTMGIRIKHGRDFLSGQLSDSAKAIISEQAALVLGFKDASSAIGEKITSGDTQNAYEVIGVVKDFELNVKHGTSAEIFFSKDIFNLEKEASFKFFLVKLSTRDIKNSMSIIDQQWKALFRDTPFDYFFLDDYFDTFYNEERRFASVFGFFSTIGIVVTCMGLFGLSLYDTNSRNKEIGIRKSLGASISGIMWMFSKSYLKLVLIATVISMPVGYFILKQWLTNYPQRISLKLDAALIPAVLMCVICLLTVGYHTFKTARVNPVNSLRND
ncbi:MAG: ABC transporter permease [Chryseolinea sp.]